MSSMRPPNRSPLQFLPVVLLLLGIAIHGYRILAHDVDPQRGSAFAMFSTVDIGATRRVLATVPGDPPTSLEIPAVLEEERSRLADAPSDEPARRLATLLSEMTWEKSGRTATVGDDVEFDHVRVQVVGFDVEGRTVSRRTVTDVTVERPDP